MLATVQLSLMQKALQSRLGLELGLEKITQLLILQFKMLYVN